MRGVAPLVMLAASCAALLYLAFFGRPFLGDDSPLAGSISDEESVIVCRDDSVQQLMIPDLEQRVLFANVDCANTFRWQLDTSFEQLLTTRPVGEGWHIFVTGLDGKSFDLSTHLGFRSSFESAVDHWNPRFDRDGRVLLLDGETLLVTDPASGAFEEAAIPAAITRETWVERNQCFGEVTLAQVSADLLSMCPWGWYESGYGGSSLSFYVPTPGVRDDAAQLVAVKATPPTNTELPLRGDLGPCTGQDVSVYWVANRLLCVGDGIGRVSVSEAEGTFSVAEVLAPTERRASNVIIDFAAEWIYFTTEAGGAVPGRMMWRVDAGGGVPEQLGLITELAGTGEHVPFTLFGAQ